MTTHRFVPSAVAPTLLATLALAACARAQLQPPFEPPGNPSTPAKVMLGKILFWDEQLSSDDSVACGTCHLPEFGGSDPRLALGRHPGPDKLFGTDDDIRGSAGVVRQDAAGDFAPIALFGLDRQVTARTSPSVMGAAHHEALFWDGRADGEFVDPETGLVVLPFGAALETQALVPILNAAEMAAEGRTWADVRQKLQQVTPLQLARDVPADMLAAVQQNPGYPGLFAAAFGDGAITATRIAFALAAYQRTLQPDDTPWDRFQAGQAGALTTSELAGWNSFVGNARCSSCHWEPLFSDDLVHNLGLRPATEDLGHFVVSGQSFDRGAFKTPTLRNAGLRPRLFHNGQSPPLGDPLQWTDSNSTLIVYLQGGGVDPSNLDPFLAPLALLGVSSQELWDVQEFVRTGLTDARAAMRLPPFDHPNLRSTALAPPREFGATAPTANAPFLIDTLPTFPGNSGFKLGLAGGQGPTAALLTWGLQSIEPGATVLGLPWHLHALGHELLLLGGSPASGLGHSTLRMPIPSDPLLTTVPFYFQLFVADPAGPNGIAASRGYEFFVVD